MRASYFAVILLFLFVIDGLSQTTRIEIVKADVFDFDKAINSDVRRLIGNVVFKHQNTLLYCDSAYQHIEKNDVDAYGHVRIVQGDTLTLTGKKLFYNDEKQMAQLFEDVVMKDRKMTLTTSRMDYDMQSNIAYYTEGAKMVDGENTLTSKLGYYHSKSHDLYFRRDVVLVNPKYEMKGDTLRYNTQNSTAYFLGPTTITSDTNFIYCESGWYDTETQVSTFTNHAYLKTKTQTLRGDTIYYERLPGFGKVTGNVSIHDSVNKITIGGDYAEHYEKIDSSFATGHALMMQLFDKDTLFLHSDTLMAKGEATEPLEGKRKNRLLAFHKVRIYKSDLQGTCDSLVYESRDSTIRFFTKPVLWSGVNQLTADSMTMQISNSDIDKIYLVNSAFIASQADSMQQGILDSLRFNQIRGKNMTGYFEKNKLHKIFVEGNGQTIYYGKNKEEKMIGVNRADCSDLYIYVKENKVQKVTLLNKPDATFYPIHELGTRELRLKGFTWQQDNRPLSKDDIFN